MEHSRTHIAGALLAAAAVAGLPAVAGAQASEVYVAKLAPI